LTTNQIIRPLIVANYATISSALSALSFDTHRLSLVHQIIRGEAYDCCQIKTNVHIQINRLTALLSHFDFSNLFQTIIFLTHIAIADGFVGVMALGADPFHLIALIVASLFATAQGFIG